MVCLLLPYRWQWLACGLGAALLACSRAPLIEALRRYGRPIVGSTLILTLQTAPDPAWWLPWWAFVAALAVGRGRGILGRRYLAAPIALAGAIALILRPTWTPAQAPARPPAGSLLVCAGDSLTAGLEPGEATYPARLARQLGVEVINAGRVNDRAEDLLARLDRDVLARRPGAVLVLIGGNDYLGGTPRALFAEQLDRLAARIAAGGSRLILVEVPSGLLWNRYAGIYRRVAARYQAILVPESRLRWWLTLELLAPGLVRERLTGDGLHLTRAGAERLADWLRPYAQRALAEY
jgi:lysophospholipase L1-like esterase